jgi:hypothetical protein
MLIGTHSTSASWLVMVIPNPCISLVERVCFGDAQLKRTLAKYLVLMAKALHFRHEDKQA